MKINQEQLKELCNPIINLIKDSDTPYLTVVITEDNIELAQTQINIPNLKGEVL